MTQGFPGSPMVRAPHFHFRGHRSIPGQETKILRTLKQKKKKKKEKKGRKAMIQRLSFDPNRMLHARLL